uniref:SPX domain-containing protein n=1 Tax=Mesocestoides corti TaxID=53468 RepID=A0A5K3EQJ4_MESCO
MDMLRRRRSTIRLKKGDKRSDDISRQIGQNEETPRLKTYDLKLALSEFYLSLVLLQNYQSLNFTGFRKILKKHDKLFQRSNGLEWHRNTVSKELFHVDNSVDSMISEVEDTFTKLEGGNRQKAMKRLRVPPLSAQSSAKSVFRFGFFLGIFLSEVIGIILVAFFIQAPQFSYPAFRFFRGSFLTIYYLCMVGVNVYGWRSSGVNHVLIFEIDPRSHLNHFQLMEVGMLFADFWGAAVLFYLFSDRLSLPGYAAPFVLFFFLVVTLLLPFHVFQYKSRLWLLKILLRIIRAPLAKVRFPDFFLADQLNSLSFILPDLAYFLCFFITFIDHNMVVKSDFRNSTIVPPGANPLFAPKAGYCDGMMWGLQPILKALPAWWRFLQCLRRYRDLTIRSPVPHLMNAGKYSTTLIAILCSSVSSINQHMAFFILMIMSKFFSSVCTTTWDLVMDWGLLDRSSKENLMLRDELVYRFRAYYYVAIVEDVIIRFAWILPIVFSHFRIIEVEIITTIVMFAEVTRRIIWNFFRLENEHLNNCGNFRAVRDIGIAPIRKDSPQTPPNENVDKRYRKFNQRFTLNRNNQRGGGEVQPEGSDIQRDDQLPALGKYASLLQNNQRKSLWGYLREAYFQTKKERRRQLDLGLIASMEEALRAAKTDVQAKLDSKSLPPRGATPTEDPATAQAHLFNEVLSHQTMGQHDGTRNSLLPLVARDQRQRFNPLSTSSSSVLTEEPTHSRRVMVDGRQRQAFARATIPLTVCLLEPQQTSSGKNRVSVCDTPGQSTCNLPVFPSEAHGLFLPRSEDADNGHGLDLVIAPEMLTQMQNDDSPDDTVLPIRTRVLANQLRELLQSFNTQLGDSTAPQPTSMRNPLQATEGQSSPATGDGPIMRWRPVMPGAYQMGQSQTTQQRRWVKRKDRSVSGSRSDSSTIAINRPKSESSLDIRATDSEEKVRHSSSETSSVSLCEEEEEKRGAFAGLSRVPEDTNSRNQRSQEPSRQPTPTYPVKFTVERREHLD